MKIHSVVAFRMDKFKIFRMQQHPVTVTAVAVKAVADNGTAQAKRVGGMNAQLMCPAGERDETDSGSTSFACQSGPFGDTHFPLFRVVYLEGSVVRVEPEGETYFPGILVDLTFKEGLVVFNNGTVHELAIQFTMASLGDGDHKQAGGVHVQAVCGGLLNHVRKYLP